MVQHTVINTVNAGHIVIIDQCAMLDRLGMAHSTGRQYTGTGTV
jgi:hypothetical protein